MGLGSPREFELSSKPLFLQYESSKKGDLCNYGINTNNFEKFLLVQRNLNKATVKNHVRYLDIFLKSVNKDIQNIEVNDIQDFMLEIKEKRTLATYKNYLSMLKILYRDYLGKENIIKDFKFPRQTIKPKNIPSKKDLKIFFDVLPSIKYKIIFLALASSGLRISELLNTGIDGRMLIPHSHEGNTKKSWITFINEETANLMENFQGAPFEVSRNTVSHVFKDTSNKTGINLSAQTLRSIFAHEMSLRKVPDRYIDAFCGRVPETFYYLLVESNMRPNQTDLAKIFRLSPLTDKQKSPTSTNSMKL